MGDCPDDEKTKNSLSIFSSNFKDYCNGKPILLYMYELFMRYELLESAAGDMPEGTGHSSTSHRPVAGRPLPIGQGERKGAKLTKELICAMSAPITIAESPAQAQLNFFAAQSMKLKFIKQRVKLSRYPASAATYPLTLRQLTLSRLLHRNLEDELLRVMQNEKSYLEAQQPVPAFLVTKKRRLEAQLEELESMPSAAPAPPQPVLHVMQSSAASSNEPEECDD